MTPIPSRMHVVELRKNNPSMTLMEIGTIAGVTRERVRQILKSENLETRSTGRIPSPMPPCKQCGTPVSNRRRTYCSPECQRPYGRTTTHCYYCQKEIVLMTSEYKGRVQRFNHLHCSRACRDADRRGKTNIRYNLDSNE